MYHEAELPSVMIGGFIIVSVIFVTAIVVLFLKTKNWKALIAFAGQWYLTYEAFQCIYNVVSGRNIHAGMASEDNSFYIGFCGLFWGISILLMLLGIYFLVRQIKAQRGDTV